MLCRDNWTEVIDHLHRKNVTDREFDDWKSFRSVCKTFYIISEYHTDTLTMSWINNNLNFYIMKNDLKVVKFLIRRNVPYQITSSVGSKEISRFAYVCGFNNSEMVQFFLEEPKIDVSDEFDLGFESAAENGCVRVMEILIRSEMMDWKKCRIESFFTACTYGYDGIIRLIIDFIDIEEHLYRLCTHTLQIMCVKKYQRSIRLILKDARVVTFVSKSKNIFKFVINNNYISMLRLLLNHSGQHNADVLHSVLIDAIKSKSGKMIHMILQVPDVVWNFDYAGNVYIRTICRIGLIHMAKKFLLFSSVDPSFLSNECIQIASEMGHYKIVRLLLNDERVDPTANFDHALISASRNGHYKTVRALLKHPDVDASTQNNSAVIEAHENGHLSIVKLLREKLNVDAGYWFHVYYRSNK